VWPLITLFFAVILLGVLMGFVPTMNIGLNSNDVGKKTVDYINKNLVQTGTATLASVEEANGLYKVTTSYQGRDIPVYVTNDGKLLFASQPIDMTQIAATTATTATTTSTQQITKTAKPTVDLYVMSFCPYGVQAETIMKPVFDLLGTKADFKIRFIATVGGTTVDSIQSLHGANEAKEDLRQVCIMKYYDAKTYWNYLQAFDTNCYPSVSDATALDACVKSSASSAGIDLSKIETCASGGEGIDLLKADEKLTNQYSISGSPTLLINSVEYSGSRSSDAFKQAICGAFTTAPSECSQTLSSGSSSSSGSAASGGCG
jgi:protein-disulfide isomerase